MMLKMIIQFRSAALGRIAIRSRNAKLSLGFLAISLISHCVSPTAQAGFFVANSGFESPVTDLASRPFAYQPSIDAQGGSGWDFPNYFAGIANNVGGFHPKTPFGQQVGFIQQQRGMSNTLSSFSQTIAGFDDSEYQVTFYAAGRTGYSGANPFVVMLDGNVLNFSGATVVSPMALSGTQGYQLFKSDYVHLMAGSHTLSFTSSAPNNGDATSFIDHVVVSSTVPEPSSLALLGIGGIGFAVSVYRRRMTKIGFLSGIRGR